MHLRALFGWGIAMYATLYLVWSTFVVYGLSANLLAHVGMIITLIALAILATRSLRITTEREILPYAIGWVLIAACLDAIVIAPVAGWAIYSDWNIWVGYGLLLAVPLVVAAVSKRSISE